MFKTITLLILFRYSVKRKKGVVKMSKTTFLDGKTWQKMDREFRRRLLDVMKHHMIVNRYVSNIENALRSMGENDLAFELLQYNFDENDPS